MVLALADQVLLVAVHNPTNLAMRQLAPLFGCSPTTECLVIQPLGPLRAIEPAARSANATDRPWIVGRLSAPVQVIVDADTRLVIATARPAPGNTAMPNYGDNSCITHRARTGSRPAARGTDGSGARRQSG